MPSQLSASLNSAAGAESYKRRRMSALPFALLLVGVLLAACSGGSPGAADAGAATPTSEADRGLAFAECMRENGVDEFPDPDDDGGNFLGDDSGIDPESPEFMKATEACRDLVPPQDEGESGGEPADLEKATEWAQCIRDNGVPDFPDPVIDGNTTVVDTTGLEDGEADSQKMDEALEACEGKRPAGNLDRRQNGGNQ
jgi:hypothetical protein